MFHYYYLTLTSLLEATPVHTPAVTPLARCVTHLMIHDVDSTNYFRRLVESRDVKTTDFLGLFRFRT